jgi:hypothetical protein
LNITIKGVRYTVSGDEISEIIISFFNNKLDNLNYELYYHPYWFTEIHIGLEKHFAILDATNSEIKIDVPELLNARKQVPVAFDDLKLDAKEGFKPEYLKYAKVNDVPEAKSIVEYKMKYIYPDKQVFVSEPHLVNIPVWEFKFSGKKITVFGNDDNYKKTVSIALDKLFPKRDKTKSELFLETVDEMKKPKEILHDFVDVFKKTNKWVLLIVLIAIITIIYYIIRNIVDKVKV